MDLGPTFQGPDDRERIYVESRLRGMSQTAAAAAAGLGNRPRQIATERSNDRRRRIPLMPTIVRSVPPPAGKDFISCSPLGVRHAAVGGPAQNSVNELRIDPSTEGVDKGPHPIRIAQKTAHHQLHAELECVVTGSLWMPLEVCSQAFERPGHIASIHERKRSLLA
jgi:hypothetical protein